MSLTQKKISYRSDSFEDRFCDDLCEDILQYLPLKDKLKLQCVSKQFQRTVLKKHNELILEVELEDCRRRLGFGSISSYEKNVLRVKYSPEYHVEQEMDPQLEVIAFESCYHKPIESLLKKCPHIQRIDITSFHHCNKVISNLMLQMITKYCNNLIEFNIFWFYSNECKSQEFCQKFGQKLKYFRYAKHMFDFNLFPNIESIDEYRVVEPIQVEEVLQLNSNNLKKLQIGIRVSEEHLLPKAMQKFQKLTHLKLSLTTNANLNKAFKDFPSHQNLLELNLSFYGNQDFEEKCYSLKEFAIKCPKIKSIELSYNTFVLKNIFEVKELFQRLKAFPSLKRLYISLKNGTGLQTEEWFSFELFRELPKIIHLSLYIYDKPLNESILKDIDIYLPKLQRFELLLSSNSRPDRIDTNDRHSEPTLKSSVN